MNNLNKLKEIYRRQPAWVKAIADALRWPYWRLKGALSRMRARVWILSGQELRSGQSITLTYSGEESPMHYWARVMFGSGSGFKVSYAGKRWVGQKDWAMSAGPPKADISVECLSLRKVKSGQGRPGFIIPVWVRGDMDFSLIDFTYKSLKEDLRRIRKNAYSFEVVAGRDLIERFYKDMLVPFARGQYGEECCLTTCEAFLSDVDNKRLLLINKDGECVAGELFYLRGKHVEVMELAVKPGRPDLIKEGAIQAIYYFTYFYFKDKPDLRIDLMGSRAFYNDGVLSFKQKWGYRLTGLLTETVLRLRLHGDTPAVRSFLINNPFIALEEDKLVGQVFLDEPVDIRDALIHLKRYLWPGIAKVRGHYFSSAKDGPVACSDDGLVEVSPAMKMYD